MEPQLDEDLSEVSGLLLGDGCVSRFEYGGKTIMEVAFTGKADEFRYYADFVRPIILKKFGVGGYLGVRADNTVRFHVRSKKLAEFLSRMSIPVGRRHDADIPQEIKDDAKLLKRFIRGFYHAEGSVYRRYSKRYPGHARVYRDLIVIQLRTKLRTLMLHLHLALMTLGISPTRLTESKGVYTFRITDQKQIRRFFRIIKPRFKVVPRTLYFGFQARGTRGPVAQPG